MTNGKNTNIYMVLERWCAPVEKDKVDMTFILDISADNFDE
jgi:hypothetical protein